MGAFNFVMHGIGGYDAVDGARHLDLGCHIRELFCEKEENNAGLLWAL